MGVVLNRLLQNIHQNMKAFIALVLLVGIAFGVETISLIQDITVEQLLEIAHGDTDDTWFIKFYGPNCGLCTSMAEEWEKFAQNVIDEELDIKVGAFDVHATENQVEEVRIFFPGPLPGLHLFPPHDKKYYEFPNPRINVKADFYTNFALFEYEEFPGTYRKSEYFYEEENPVVTINGENFDQFIAEHADTPIFVYFFGPKCGWCKTKFPIWEQFAVDAIAKESKFIVARMDGFSNMQVIDRYTARPWPSMVYIENGKYYRLDTEIGRDI